MNNLELPTRADIDKIYQGSVFPALNQPLFDLLEKLQEPTGFSSFLRGIELEEFLFELHYRLVDAGRSYAFLSYFFEKGIPDERWHISPGTDGSSIEYWPDFEPVHYLIKDWFDYYCDVFYYKLFSALDMIGQLFNLTHDLGMRDSDVTFGRIVCKLAYHDEALHKELESMRVAPAFEQASRLRNSATHRHRPSSTGISVTRDKNGAGVGIRPYTTSAEIMANVHKMPTVLERILGLLLSHV